MSRDEVEALKGYVQSLEIRIVKLEMTIKVGGMLLGVIPTALQIYQIFWRH
jgi:hypothetical protein